MSSLNLADFEERTSEAVRFFWETRSSAVETSRLSGKADQGERSGVTNGKNMDGFVNLIAELVEANGLYDAEVHLTRATTSLPGYFRPTKDWDIVVTRRGALIAVVELKSQVGPSFGNNFNNRTEEAIGSAVDIWTAFREGAFGDQPRPFIGWLTHVEDAPSSQRPVRNSEPHFDVFPEHRGNSYLERYEELCKKLVLENLYTATALITSTREEGLNGKFRDLSDLTSLRRFVIEFSGHIAKEAAA